MVTRNPVDAPPIQLPVYGLIPAAPIVDNDPELRWGGIAYAPEGCGVSGVGVADCAAGPLIDDLPDNPATVTADAMIVWAGDQCSTFGSLLRDFRGRAQRQLEATRSYQIAHELWTGELRTSAGLDNRAFVDNDADIVTGAASPPVDALGCVERAMAHYLHGPRGMIHVPPDVHSHLVTQGTVRLQGNTWVSPNGHIVVPDAGYEVGTGPGAAAGRWIYGTGMVSIRLGPVLIVPTDSDEARQLAQAMDHSINSIRYVAMQPAIASWDACVHVAALTNVPNCAIDAIG